MEGATGEIQGDRKNKKINKYFIEPLGGIQKSRSQQPTNPHIQNESRQKIHKIQYGQYLKAINTLKDPILNY